MGSSVDSRWIGRLLRLQGIALRLQPCRIDLFTDDLQ
jgi:hypothetical protein